MKPQRTKEVMIECAEITKKAYKFPLESEEYKSFHLKLKVQVKTKEVQR